MIPIKIPVHSIICFSFRIYNAKSIATIQT